MISTYYITFAYLKKYVNQTSIYLYKKLVFDVKKKQPHKKRLKLVNKPFEKSGNIHMEKVVSADIDQCLCIE